MKPQMYIRVVGFLCGPDNGVSERAPGGGARPAVTADTRPWLLLLAPCVESLLPFHTPIQPWALLPPLL